MTETLKRKQLIRYSHMMYQAGWVANHDGNLSSRIGRDRLVITPTAMSKIDIGLDDLVVVDGQGKKIAGRRRPFSEMVLHLAVFNQRSDVGAVIHAPPPFATAFGVAGRPLPHPFLPEAVVSLGGSIPTVPLSMPGRDAADALNPFVRRCDAVMIAGNGVLAWGPDLELAYLRLELVEHVAKIAHHSHNLGGVQQLPQDMVQALLAKRQKAGLGAPDEFGDARSESRESRVQSEVIKAVAGRMPSGDLEQIRKLTREIAESILT